MVNAGVLKLVDKLDLGSSAERRMGSIPFARTITAPCDREPLSVYLHEAAASDKRVMRQGQVKICDGFSRMCRKDAKRLSSYF